MPSIADMQASLIHENDEDVVTPVCQMLLQAALDDPGVEGPQVKFKTIAQKSNPTRDLAFSLTL